MLRQESIRHFLVTKRFGKLEYIRVFDDEAVALRAYEQEERECGLFGRISEDDAQCLLLGADSLSTLLTTHGNWFDEPSKLGQILDESSFGPKSRPDPRKEEDTMDGDRISAHYDAKVDALHIALTQVSRVDRTIEATEGLETVMLDMKDDQVVGIEILYPRQPLRLAKIAAEHGFAADLDAIYQVTATVLGMSVSGAAKLSMVEAWAAR